METRLCRICGKLGQNFVHLFKTEGLKNKVETCLPIIISPHSLLPDTICGECLDNVDNFYAFIKNCLQNIIILESQYDITDSCLKTKRKHEKGCSVDIVIPKLEKSVQTDDYLDILLQQINESDNSTSKLPSFLQHSTDGSLKVSTLKRKLLVDYDVDSEHSDSEGVNDKNAGKVILAGGKTLSNRLDDLLNNLLVSKNNLTLHKQYFDDPENDLISEIAQRKTLKRKCDSIESSRTKIFKLDTSNRRKSKQPKKVECRTVLELKPEADPGLEYVALEKMYEEIDPMVVPVNTADMERLMVTESVNNIEQETDQSMLLPQTCLLCSKQFQGPAALTTHVFENHGIDMAQIISTVESQNDKKKKLPNLVKISDLKRSDSIEDNQEVDQVTVDEVVSQVVGGVPCPLCPGSFASKQDLFGHLRTMHVEEAGLICGLCQHQASSHLTLRAHVEACSQTNVVTSKYYCQACMYGEDSSKLLEQHVLVHSFLLDECKRQAKMFDPDDFIGVNTDFNPANGGSPSDSKSLTCSECGQADFETFKEFSSHRRNKHSIFHCDLCSKFYGRNSHLWKHVNRLHKGHPSITCQLCRKTSASKYHLSQHFAKIHSTRPCRQRTPGGAGSGELNFSNDNSEDFMMQKFQAFDFQSVKQSFMRQEILEQEKKLLMKEEPEDNSNQVSEEENNDEKTAVETPKFVEPPHAPKEIDASSDLYTNIITNYTPPVNEGEFKCPKCGKGFHKKNLLKKHKKNCRPRLQKDLLTRCKTCSRIFKDRQSLAKHLVNYHSEYICELCGQKVQSKCEIVAHIRFTHPGCHLTCSLCRNILRSQADLTDHQKNHQDSYICQFCADSLPSKIKLKMHILSLHRKILSLSCGICLKLFESQHVLRDHVRLVHKNQLTPLTSCPVCGKNYGSKWKTYDHLNKSHGRAFKACKTCLEVFNTDYELQTHYDLTHPQTNMNQKPAPIAINNTPNCTNEAKTDYNSEPEGDSDENSDQSNEMENYNSHHEKPSDPEDQKSNDYISLADITMTHSKISLLEKRLMGKNSPEETTTCINDKKHKSSGNKQLNSQSSKVIDSKKSDGKHKISSMYTEQNMIDARRDTDEQVDASYNSNSNNPLQNSSKRTVYVNSNDPSLCEICLKTWPAKKHLWQHYIRCHKSVAATVCGICLKTNSDYAALQTHLVENHPTLLHGQGFGSNFICRICGRYHNASSKLKLHMAIHENFDWSLLESSMSKTPESQSLGQSNGYQYEDYIIKKEEPIDDEIEINYESLIEQVECSESDNEVDNRNHSSSEIDEDQDDEEDEEDDQEDVDEDEEGEDGEDGGDEESENESVVSEPSLETQMLKNMLREKQQLALKKSEKSQNSDSSDSDDSSNSSFSDTEERNDSANIQRNDTGNCSSEEDVSRSSQVSSSSQNKSDDSSDEMAISSNNMFAQRPDELDSAIKSISYMNNIDEVDNDVEDEFCELQAQNLNENEIESAVGSIL